MFRGGEAAMTIPTKAGIQNKNHKYLILQADKLSIRIPALVGMTGERLVAVRVFELSDRLFQSAPERAQSPALPMTANVQSILPL